MKNTTIYLVINIVDLAELKGDKIAQGHYLHAAEEVCKNGGCVIVESQSIFILSCCFPTWASFRAYLAGWDSESE